MSPSTVPAVNRATVDITVADTGYLTVGGIDLKTLGVAPLDAATVQIAKNLDSVHLVVQSGVVTVELHGVPTLKIQWDQASRQVVASLAARYGYTVSPELMARIEEWISTSNFDITARYSNELSKPAVINFRKLIWVDLGSNGQVSVEKAPLAVGLDPSVMGTIKQSGVQNATACWSKGTLVIKTNSTDLPTITMNPDGVRFLAQSLGLPIQNMLQPLFGSQFGVDVSLPGGAHQTGATCGQ